TTSTSERPTGCSMAGNISRAAGLSHRTSIPINSRTPSSTWSMISASTGRSPASIGGSGAVFTGDWPRSGTGRRRQNRVISAECSRRWDGAQSTKKPLRQGESPGSGGEFLSGIHSLCRESKESPGGRLTIGVHFLPLRLSGDVHSSGGVTMRLSLVPQERRFYALFKKQG